ncbi:MAG: type I phosphomannose isomerase catalytic subunit [Gemmatimonadota bacterium]
MALYPLVFRPIYKEKVWGGRTLEQLGRTLPGGASVGIGESWELADLDQTSPSGGGGAAAHSVIRNGPLTKRTIRDLLADLWPHVMGPAALTDRARFPVLLKYLDARENLSVQVHPSPEYAANHPDAVIKYEAYYIVRAEPDAVVYKGVVEGVGPDELRAAIDAGTVPELLVAVPVREGEMHYLPSGTLHALGRGILAAEVQTVSDTTFRVFDWGRTDRDLHVEEALASIDFAPTDATPWERDEPVSGRPAAGRRLVTTPYFEVVEWTLDNVVTCPWPDDRLAALMVVGGAGRIRWGADGDRSVDVTAGDTVLIPASLRDAWSETDGAMTVLEITLPDAHDSRGGEDG